MPAMRPARVLEIVALTMSLALTLALSLSLVVACDAAASQDTEYYFCPEDECKDRVVEQIDRADSTVVAAVFTFTHYDIAQAMARAVSERGVQVWVVVEKNQLDAGLGAFLTSRGVGFRTDTNPQLMHHKFTVIDDHTVLTGSFNYTNQADQKNDENLVILYDRDGARRFFDEFQELWDSAEDF